MDEHFVAWPRISNNAAQQAAYDRMRAAGESHSMAEMLATRSFPGVKGTDSVFMEGRKLGGQQFEADGPGVGQHHLAAAAAAGVNTSGKWYSGALARYPGDPRAWVSGLGDVRRIARERNIGLTGAVEIPSPKYGDGYVPPAKYAAAPSIVREHVEAAIGDQPISAGEREALTETVQKKLAGVRG